MRVLLTGASSFTGLWFARALNEDGHHVVAALRRTREAYAGSVRALRVARLAEVAECVFGLSFGDERFLDLCRSGPWDLLCHHAAEVGDYRSAEFDVERAVSVNTRNFTTAVRGMRGVSGVVLTGSVFEAGEGTGTKPLGAFSPYAASKGATAAIVRRHCRALGVPLGKFVIPNPFGPYEEPRFCAYLMRQWREGGVAEVRTPAYVRDNIHVDLLAQAYAAFAAAVPRGPRLARHNPSGYVGTQGAFAERFAAEIAKRSDWDCALVMREQTEFPEPAVRVNTDPIEIPGWNEERAWDAIASFYEAAPAHAA